ncbi:MAG: hypothetical protein JO269_02685 [Burkholderiaceae bacterium]|nr:hypothetical protein [Burkholderiaceae bacterium]
MQAINFLTGLFAVCATALAVTGCGTPPKMSDEQLASLGVKSGAMYWDAEQKLASQGYQCHVAGARREKFDCTQTKGFFPTCILRIDFTVEDSNLISNLRVAEPVCVGTP